MWSFKTEIQHCPGRGGGWIICLSLPFGVKHSTLAEVLSLQFTEIILQDFWVLKFKSLHLLNTHNFQSSCGYKAAELSHICSLRV